MNLDLFNHNQKHIFSIFYVKVSDCGKNLLRLICVLCEEMKSMIFAIKPSVNPPQKSLVD